MFNPTYLQRSRHGIFYFRWTLARPSEGDQSTSIRFSLRTREPRQALQLAMPLSYLARSFTIKGQRHGMDHKQLRAVLIDHFGRFLAAHKAKIDANGPLSDNDRTLLESTVGIAEMELQSGPLNETDTDRNAVEFIRRYDLGIDPGTGLNSVISVFAASLLDSGSVPLRDILNGPAALVLSEPSVENVRWLAEVIRRRTTDLASVEAAGVELRSRVTAVHKGTSDRSLRRELTDLKALLPSNRRRAAA